VTDTRQTAEICDEVIGNTKLMTNRYKTGNQRVAHRRQTSERYITETQSEKSLQGFIHMKEKFGCHDNGQNISL